MHHTVSNVAVNKSKEILPWNRYPADLLSHGQDAYQLCNCALWWESPPFLYKLCEDAWPKITKSNQVAQPLSN